MSRGPGAVERGVLHALARYGPMNATELAQDIFELWGTLELEPTAAQLGSVRRAIRHLAARGVTSNTSAEAAAGTGSSQSPISGRGDSADGMTPPGLPRRSWLTGS